MTPPQINHLVLDFDIIHDYCLDELSFSYAIVWKNVLILLLITHMVIEVSRIFNELSLRKSYDRTEVIMNSFRGENIYCVISKQAY